MLRLLALSLKLDPCFQERLSRPQAQLPQQLAQLPQQLEHLHQQQVGDFNKQYQFVRHLVKK